jgi:hypothetical protein
VIHLAAPRADDHHMDAVAPLRAPAGRPALEGSLSDLAPADLLRLLGETRQTGTLQVLAGGPALLTLVDGAVSYATTDPERTLRHVLRDEGLLGDGVWEGATAGVDGEDELGSALVAAGVSESGIVDALRRVVLDVAAELVTASGGRFRFVAGPRHALGARFHYPAAQLARDLGGCVDEWRSISATVPSLDGRARLAPTLPPGRDDVTIGAAEWRVLVAVERGGSLEQVRAALGATRFGFSRRVAALVRSGALELVDDREP